MTTTENKPKQRRNRRAGVIDLWTKTVHVIDPETGEKTAKKVDSLLNGKGKRWQARYVDDQGCEKTKAFGVKAEAQTWLNEQMSSLVTGTHVDPKLGKITVGQVREQWSKAQAHLKETTGATREVTWSAYVEERWATTSVADVRTSDVRLWVAELAQRKTKTGKREIGPATIENALGVLRMVLDLAVEDRRIPRNPCTGVKSPRRQHKQRGYLTHEQVEQLAQKVSLRPEVVRFLAYTGLRWGEMAALKVENFDMLRRRVNVVRAVAEVKGKLVWSTAKNHERRSVPFPSFLAEELAALMEGKGRDDLVFASVTEETLRVSVYRPRVFTTAVTALHNAAKKAREEEKAKNDKATTPEFPRITPHDLRHTAASLAISAGANVKAVQTMLGHKSAAMTLDTYADLFPDDLEAVAEALDKAARAARNKAS